MAETLPPFKRAWRVFAKLTGLSVYRKLDYVRAELLEARRQIKRWEAKQEERPKELSTLERVASTLFREQVGLDLLPPPDLRLHVGRTTDAANFWNQGMTSSRRVIEVFGKAPKGLVLDWGCGSGRTYQWLHALPAWRRAWRGCDVDPEAVAWLQGKGVKNSQVCGDLPPLPYDDATFDGFYCFSVLTHIHPEHHGAWYGEIARVLKPGGRAYLTVQSDATIDLGKAYKPEELEGYAKMGWWWSEREGHYKHSAVVSKAFTLKLLEPLFEIEAYAPAGYHRMDAITVRKP